MLFTREIEDQECSAVYEEKCSKETKHSYDVITEDILNIQPQLQLRFLSRLTTRQAATRCRREFATQVLDMVSSNLVEKIFLEFFENVDYFRSLQKSESSSPQDSVSSRRI